VRCGIDQIRGIGQRSNGHGSYLVGYSKEGKTRIK
jgi:hypothetical protein